MPRILVADDNTNIQRMVSLAFQERGIEVTAVGNGEAAVRRVPDLNPDLILADIFMPVRNGYELCEWVKKDPKFSHIPVILLVGAFDPLDEKEARRVGADGVLKKPFIPPDPLIAMVVSVLEKNAKLPAEPAKPKESPAAAFPAVVAAAHEAPLNIEPKPLPEFPEPSPEEASLIYGFGAGRRTLDDDDAEDPVALAAPKAETEDDQGSQEEFDGASTTNDWRRSAMDFKVPEEAARRPAFSSDEEIDSTFPSERDVQPKHVDVADAIKAIEPVAPEIPESELTVPELAALETKDLEAVENVPFDFAPEESEPEAVLAESAPTETEPVSAPVAMEIADSDASSPLVAKSPAPAVEDSAVAPQPEVKPKPSFLSRAAHWMDLMASSAEPPSGGDWFASTFGKRREADSPQLESAQPPAQSETVENSSIEELPVIPASGEDDDATISSPEAVIEAQAADFKVEEPFFADDPEPSQPPLAVESPIEEPAVAVASDTEAFAGPLGEIAWGPTDEPTAEALAETDSEFDTETYDEPTLAKDPDLVEPAAVHVAPEPLLVDEAPRDPLGYGGKNQEIAPNYDFLSAQAEGHVAEEHVFGDNVHEQRAEKEFQPLADRPKDHSLEFSSAAFDDRTTAITPSNREALAEIAFLNPPPELFDPVEEYAATNGALDSSAIDMIVARVLERIEPQLRELLSQNVLKPLVESLLQNEAEKKSR